MSEEQLEQNDGSWSGLKKTIVGTLGTVVAGGGVWLSTLLFGGHEEAKDQPAPVAQPTIVINNSQQQQAAPTTKTVVVKEVQAAQPKPAEPAKPKKQFQEDPKW